MTKITLNTLQKMVQQDEKIAMLTCYDASFAHLFDRSGVDILLIGDSLGMVIQNEPSTLAVTLEQMKYHTRCVARGAASRALVLADMPFGCYQQSPQQAFASAVELMQSGAQMVKLEGGALMADTVHFLVERGIPVCAHIGLTPQSVHVLSGFRVQGKTTEDAQRIMQDAKQLAASGANMIVLECIPAELACQITKSVAVPTIGIGAGPDVGGQVLVMHDLLGLYPGKTARFVKNFMQGADSIESAICAYVQTVKDKTFPGPEHCF